MKKVSNNTSKQKVLTVIVNAIVEKKEVKSRFQNGENLRKIAKDKGFEVVMPL